MRGNLDRHTPNSGVVSLVWPMGWWRCQTRVDSQLHCFNLSHAKFCRTCRLPLRVHSPCKTDDYTDELVRPSFFYDGCVAKRSMPWRPSYSMVSIPRNVRNATNAADATTTYPLRQLHSLRWMDSTLNRTTGRLYAYFNNRSVADNPESFL